MIDVIENPNSTVEAAVCDYLANASATLGATVEHDPRWLRVLHQAMGHKPYVILANNRAGQVNGYLPLVLVASRLFGRFLVSLPYLNHAGTLAEHAELANELVDAAVNLADRLDVQYFGAEAVSRVGEHCVDC